MIREPRPHTRSIRVNPRFGHLAGSSASPCSTQGISVGTLGGDTRLSPHTLPHMAASQTLIADEGYRWATAPEQFDRMITGFRSSSGSVGMEKASE